MVSAVCGLPLSWPAETRTASSFAENEAAVLDAMAIEPKRWLEDHPHVPVSATVMHEGTLEGNLRAVVQRPRTWRQAWTCPGPILTALAAAPFAVASCQYPPAGSLSKAPRPSSGATT